MGNDRVPATQQGELAIRCSAGARVGPACQRRLSSLPEGLVPPAGVQVPLRDLLVPGACRILGQMKSGTSPFSRSAQVREPWPWLEGDLTRLRSESAFSCWSLCLWNRSRLPKAVFNAWVTRVWSRRARATGHAEVESSLRQG